MDGIAIAGGLGPLPIVHTALASLRSAGLTFEGSFELSECFWI